LKLDAYGDPIPRGAKLRLGTVRWRFDHINQLSFSSDDQALLACMGQTLIEYDRATGQVRRTRRFGDAEQRLNLSTDCKTLYGLSREGFIRRWEVQSGKELPIIGDKNTSYDSITFSVDHSLCAAEIRATERIHVEIWDTRKDKKLHRFTVPNQTNNRSMKFSPDSKLFAYQRGSLIQLFDLVSGKIVREIRHESRMSEEEMNVFTFVPNSSTLITGHANGSLRYWDVHTGENRLTGRPNNRSIIYEINVSPNATLPKVA
jgi:WD40 repeat protein